MNEELKNIVLSKIRKLRTKVFNKKREIERDLIHEWFGLSYSNYLVLQRSILQSMPNEWQKRFVDCLNEVYDATRELPDKPDSYWVRARGEKNRFIRDPYSNYERGRRVVKLKDN